MSTGKALLEVKAADSYGPHGGFEGIMSAPTLDRDGEVVDAYAFDPLPKRITIDTDHRMTVRDTVGSGQPFYDRDGVLRIRAAFSSLPFAQDVRTLIKEGHIDRMSVVFMNPKRKMVDGVPHVTKAELLNVAVVAIPANREAAITAAKTYGAADPMSGVRRDVAEALAVLDDLDGHKSVRDLLAQAYLDALEVDVEEMKAALYAGRPYSSAIADLLRDLRRI